MLEFHQSIELLELAAARCRRWHGLTEPPKAQISKDQAICESNRGFGQRNKQAVGWRENITAEERLGSWCGRLRHGHDKVAKRCIAGRIAGDATNARGA